MINRNAFQFSHRLCRLALTGAFVAILGFYTGCNSAPKGPIAVDLQFRPSRAEPISGSLPPTDVKVHVAAVEDKRADKETIGKNMQDATPLPVHASGAAPAEFVQNVLNQEMQSFGIDLTDAAEAADRIVAVSLNKFWVEETGTFRGEVSGIAEVKDKGGRVLWKGPIGGQGTTFGRSRSAANYNLVLSDATRRAVGSLLTNPKFTESLTK
jgi:hypothetical protein